MRVMLADANSPVQAKNGTAVIFLDLDSLRGRNQEEKVEEAVKWIKEQQLRNRPPDCAFPIYILIAAEELEPKYRENLLHSGALFVNKPEGYDTIRERVKKERCLNDLLGTYFQEVGNDDFLSLQPPTVVVQNGDLSIYDNPPYEIDDDSWEWLMKRWQMSDADRGKND